MVSPQTHTTTHIDIKSQPERHTINKEELANINVALRYETIEVHLKILTDNSLFCINTIRNYTIDPASYKHHLHKDLPHLIDQLLRDRDTKEHKLHIGKVKSHTDIEYNDTADTTATVVVDGNAPPDITFDEAKPSSGASEHGHI